MGQAAIHQSYAHVNELCYQAVRRAILPSIPVARDDCGRFVSRREITTSRLRASIRPHHVNEQVGEGT
jgi:hypothetical protein